jgi:MIP family channel proteins
MSTIREALVYNLIQKLVAEFVGTFALVFFGAGAVCVDFYLRGSGGAGPLAVALASGLTFAIMVSALGHISGGHFNPAITIGFWVTKRLSTMDSLAYWAVQLAAGAAAAFLLKVLIPEDVASNIFLGAPELMRDYPHWSGMALEAVATFFVVLVFFATTVDERASFRSVGGFAIGLTVALGVLVAGPFTGGALNPARAFGPEMVSRHWLNWGIYWVGPLSGGFLAGLLYDTLFLRKNDI